MNEALTPKEREAFRRFLDANQIHYWFTDNARRAVLESAQIKPWSFDECMKRLNQLKADLEGTGDAEVCVKFFAALRDYEQPRAKGALPHPAAAVALREENAMRIYKLWFKHFDDWYTDWQAQQERFGDEYAF